MAIKIFICYAHEDEALLNKLKSHLKPLQRQGLIDIWHDRDISAGTEWEQEIKEQLNAAEMILLLVSPNFMNSDYINNVELQRAMERHGRKEAQVIPIVLRPVYWQGAPFGKLQALPTDAKPVASWSNKDNAFLDIIKGIRQAIERLPSLSSTEKLPNLVSQKPNQQFQQLDLQPLLTEKSITENHKLENQFQADNSDFFERLFIQNVHEIMQALLSYQLPWGEWGDIGSEERLKRGDRVSHIGIQDVVLKPNVARSMFSIILIRKLDLKKFNYRCDKCLSWMNGQKINGWFYEWRLGQSNSSETYMPDLNKSPDIRHTAQSGTTAILLNQVDLSVIRTLENILDSQLHFGAWSNDPNSKQEALFATAYCLEFVYNLLNFSNKESLNKFVGIDLISRCRSSLDRGISWLYDETKKFRGYFGSERRASSYLTAMVLLRIHKPFFERFPEVRALVVENLLRNNDNGTWVDERHTNAQFYEMSRYPTTIRVLDLLTQISQISILDETIVQQGYQFLANEYRRDLSEPPDLALLLEALINTRGIDAIKSILREEELYDSWKGEPSSLTSEMEWVIQYYNDWRLRSYERISAIQTGISHLASGYDIALQEENLHIATIDAFIERIKRASR